MATAGSVHRISSSTTLSSVRDICGIKYIGASNGTAVVKADSTSGMVLWQEAGTSNVFNDVKIRNEGGIRVELTNSAILYIYTRIT